MKKSYPHPGRLLKYYILPELGISQTKAAELLGVNRVSFCNVCNGDAAISPEMAKRLELWLAQSITATTWLKLQNDYDLSHVDTTVLKVYPISDLALPPHSEAKTCEILLKLNQSTSE
jgi:addiction module HigA family antidote